MRQLQDGQSEAVDRAADNADDRADEEDERPWHAVAIGDRQHHHGERHDRADGKIDAGGDDDDEHAERQERQRGVLLDDIGEVCDRQGRHRAASASRTSIITMTTAMMP